MQPLEGVSVCLGVGFVLWEVCRNCQDGGAGFWGEKGDGKVWLVFLWNAKWLDGLVGVFVDCEYGAARASFGEFIVECRVVYKFVILKRLSPYRFDISVFGFCKGDDVGF